MMKVVSAIKNVTIKITMAFASVLMVMMAAFVTYEVILRWVFGRSTMVSTDFAAYLMGVIFYWGASKALDDDTFVRMDILYDSYKGKFKKILNICFSFLFLIFNCVVMHYYLIMLRNTIARDLRAINI